MRWFLVTKRLTIEYRAVAGNYGCRVVCLNHVNDYHSASRLEYTIGADRVKTRCLAATSVLRVTEDHERHCVTPRIVITPVSPRGDQIRPVSAIRSGTGGRASQPGAAFTAAINLPNATRLSTRLML